MLALSMSEAKNAGEQVQGLASQVVKFALFHGRGCSCSSTEANVGGPTPMES